MVLSAELREGEASRRGVQYEVANGVCTPNLGEKTFLVTTGEGVSKVVTAQVCEVNKPFLSVRKVVAGGNRVVFDQEGSYIEDKTTGERMRMEEKNGMQILKAWTRSSGSGTF